MAARSFCFWFFAMLVLPVAGYCLTIAISKAALEKSPTDKNVIGIISTVYTALFGALALLGFMHCLLHVTGFRPTGVAKGSIASKMMGSVKGRIGMHSPYSRLQSAGVSGMGSLTCLIYMIIGACFGCWLSYRLLP